MSTPPPLPAKKRKPVLPWIIGGILALLLVSLIGIGAIIIFSDDPPVDDSAMRPKWHSEEERLAGPLAQLLKRQKDHPIESDERLGLAGSKTSWDQGKAEALLAEHEEHLRALDELLITDPETWHWPAGPDMAHYDAPTPELQWVQRLGSLQTIRSKAASTSAGALDHAKDGLRLGAGLAAAEGTEIHALVSMTLYSQCLAALSQAVMIPSVRDTELSAARATLNEHFISSRSLAFGVRVNHELLRNTMDDILSGKDTRLRADVDFARLRVLMKPQRGLGLSLKLNERTVQVLEAGWVGLGSEVDRRKDELVRRKSNPLRLLSDGVGCMLSTITATGSSQVLLLGIDTETQRRLAIAQIALRQYELANGHLPASLAELKLPEDDIADPWSQAPLIWNRDTLLLYSVGRNGTDDGGAFNTTKPREGPDRGGRYWWAPGE